MFKKLPQHNKLNICIVYHAIKINCFLFVFKTVIISDFVN